MSFQNLVFRLRDLQHRLKAFVNPHHTYHRTYEAQRQAWEQVVRLMKFLGYLPVPGTPHSFIMGDTRLNFRLQANNAANHSPLSVEIFSRNKTEADYVFHQLDRLSLLTPPR